MSARFVRFSFLTTLAILAFSAMATLYISTPAGAGLANDSVAYIAGARSILLGQGYSDIWLDSTLEPITHYPPLLSLTLSAIGLFGIDPMRGARILNILLFGANTLLMGMAGWRMTHSQAAGLWLAALFMLNASMLRIHVFAMSEPLFLFLSLLAFLFIDLYLAGPNATPTAQVSESDKGQTSSWLVLAGSAAGLAFLTRYSGLALLPTFAIALFLFQYRSKATRSTGILTATNQPDTLVGQRPGYKTWRAHLATIGLFLVGATPPIAAWFLRNKFIAGNVTNRSFQFHPITTENIQPGFYNFSQFLMPIEPWRQAIAKSGLWEWIIASFGLGLLIWLAIWSWAMIFPVPNRRQPQFLTYSTALYMFGYLSAVLFSMSFFDASTKFQPRILAPLYTSFMLLLVACGTWLWRSVAKRPVEEIKPLARVAVRVFVIVLVVITLTLSAYKNFQEISEFKTAGQGYASWKWHDSLIMVTLRDLPLETAIYTNTPPAVYLVTGRASRVLPTPIDPVDNLARGDYEQNVAQMRADLITGKAVLALFDTANLEETPGMQNIETFIAGLKVVQKAQGDVLYGKP